MHISGTFWGLIFGLTLFILFAYKFYNLIVTYVVPYLSEQLRLLKKNQIELLEKEKLVTSTLSKIGNQVKQQQKMFMLLEKKKQLWHQVISDKRRKQEEVYRVIIDQVEKKRVVQHKNLGDSKMALEAVPQMIRLVYGDLTRTYIEEKKSGEFLKQYIENLDSLNFVSYLKNN